MCYPSTSADGSLPVPLQVHLHAGAGEMWASGAGTPATAHNLPGTNGIIQHYLKVKAQSRTMSQIISVHHNITQITDTRVSRETAKTVIRLHTSRPRWFRFNVSFYLLSGSRILRLYRPFVLLVAPDLVLVLRHRLDKKIRKLSRSSREMIQARGGN